MVPDPGLVTIDQNWYDHTRQVKEGNCCAIVDCEFAKIHGTHNNNCLQKSISFSFTFYTYHRISLLSAFQSHSGLKRIGKHIQTPQPTLVKRLQRLILM